jgi:hypothetical protein
VDRHPNSTRLGTCSADPGESFTVDGVTLQRARLARHSPRVWAEEPVTGQRRDLTREDDNTFWAWAAVEVLRATGCFSRGRPWGRVSAPGVCAGQKLIVRF